MDCLQMIRSNRRRNFPMPIFGILFLLSFFLFTSFASPRRHRHFSRQQLEPVPDEEIQNDGEKSTRHHHHQHHRRAPRIICVHGSLIGGRCICDQGWAGTNCQWEMHCSTFERNSNGSCVLCQPNFTGDRCERPDCQNGGEESADEQRCDCPKPFSGQFCEELLTTNVYYYYNSKVATIGPLGLIAVIPMIGIYVICERFARKRQVRRIEKTWNEQSSENGGTHLKPAHIELLLRKS